MIATNTVTINQSSSRIPNPEGLATGHVDVAKERYIRCNLSQLSLQRAPSKHKICAPVMISVLAIAPTMFLAQLVAHELSRCSWLSSERRTRAHALTPLLSPFASSARIFEFTIDLASSRYQRRQALAYISAASSSVTNIARPQTQLTRKSYRATSMT